MGLGIFGYFLLAVGLGCLGVICFAVWHLINVYTRLEISVDEKYDKLVEKIEDYEERVNLVSEHAFDYRSSLSAEGSKALYQLQTILSSQRRILGQIESELSIHQPESLRRADVLLDEALGEKRPKAKETMERFVPHWGARAEALLQLLGLDVALASKSADEAGAPPRRKRRKTGLNLRQAGILAVLKNEDKDS